MLESKREFREPWLIPPTTEERWLRQRLEERDLRRKKYFANKRSKEVRYNGTSSSNV